MGRNSLKSVMRLIDSANEKLSPEQSFLNDFKRSMELQNSKNSRKPSQSYKPSSMNCIRNMYYQIVGAEQDDGDTSYVLIGIVNQGSDIHERIQQSVIDMKENGMDCEYVNVERFIHQRDIKDVTVVAQVGAETKLKHDKLNMSFMCDGIIKYKNKYYILEIKTETSSKWFSRKAVDPKHYNQATAYSIALGLDNVMFLYISRDTFDLKSYLFHVDDRMKYDVISKIEECDGYVKNLKVPPKPDNADNKLCQYCAYKKLCRKDG